jgi:hypothetical protein
VNGGTILTLSVFGFFALLLIGYLMLGGGKESGPPPPGPEGHDHGERQKPWRLPDEVRRQGKQL